MKRGQKSYNLGTKRFVNNSWAQSQGLEQSPKEVRYRVIQMTPAVSASPDVQCPLVALWGQWHVPIYESLVPATTKDLSFIMNSLPCGFTTPSCAPLKDHGKKCPQSEIWPTLIWEVQRVTLPHEQWWACHVSHKYSEQKPGLLLLLPLGQLTPFSFAVLVLICRNNLCLLT